MLLVCRRRARARRKDRTAPRRPAADDSRLGGPPEQETTAERYKELAEAGFTHNYTGFGNATRWPRRWTSREAAGVKLIDQHPELASDPEGTAKRFRAHPASAATPCGTNQPPAISTGWRNGSERIQSVDAEHPCYINLYPNYCPPRGWGLSTYREYVQGSSAEVPVQVLSFDHYPVVGNKLRPEWYENLEIVSAASREADKPFWAICAGGRARALPRGDDCPLPRAGVQRPRVRRAGAFSISRTGRPRATRGTSTKGRSGWTGNARPFMTM